MKSKTRYMPQAELERRLNELFRPLFEPKKKKPAAKKKR